MSLKELNITSKFWQEFFMQHKKKRKNMRKIRKYMWYFHFSNLPEITISS